MWAQDRELFTNVRQGALEEEIWNGGGMETEKKKKKKKQDALQENLYRNQSHWSASTLRKHQGAREAPRAIIKTEYILYQEVRRTPASRTANRKSCICQN